jgi:hypothetical protein
VVFAIEVGVIYLSATVPDSHGDEAPIVLTVSRNAQGRRCQCAVCCTCCYRDGGGPTCCCLPSWRNPFNTLPRCTAGQQLPDGPVSLTLTYVKPSPVLKAYAEVCCVLWQAQRCLELRSVAVCCMLVLHALDGSRCSSCAAAGSQPLSP